MPYVIFNKQTNKYIKHPSTWVGRLSKATKFKTEENASNFLSCPPRALALPPIEALAILSTDNLTDIYNTSYSFTEETAQQEFEELKSFLSATLSSFDKLTTVQRCRSVTRKHWMFFTRLNSAMSARRMAISSINSFRKSVSAAGTQKTTSKLQVWCYRLGCWQA